MNYVESAKEQKEYAVRIHRYLHQHPEPPKKEENTVALICHELEANKIPYVDVPNGGVLGFLGDPQKGKTVLLRADIDALPIQEAPVNGGGNPKAVISQIENVAHLCGHDFHTAMLLAAAKILKQHEDELEGRIILMFERGEEGGGNLSYLIKWIFDQNLCINSSFAMHVVPSIPVGKISASEGYQFAGSMAFTVWLTGKPAHGSEPSVGRSTIDCFSAIHRMLQEFRMKYANPYDPMVFSVGQVHAGTSYNTIPDHLEFSGSFRVFNFDDGLRIKQKLIDVVEKTAQLYDCTSKIDIFGPSPSVNNDKACTEFAQQEFIKMFGDAVLEKTLPQMGSDSHSLTINTWPGVYMLLGNRNEEKGMTATNHDPHFEADEDSIPVGIACHLAYAVEYLKHGPDTSEKAFHGTIEELFRKYRPAALDILKES